MTSAVASPTEPAGATAVAARWDNVRIRYPWAQRDAVGPVSLSVNAGTRMLLLGPSGCGKSTLLQSLTGIVPHSIPAVVEGGICLLGEAVDARTPACWAARVAQLFQDPEQTLFGLRVEDEIAFALENRALDPAEISRRVDVAMTHVGLGADWRERRTATLSTGEKQRVALAAALAQDATLFVADEPTASLAPAVAERLRATLLDSRRSRRTVLVVDHRLDTMIRHIDRVAVLDRDGALMAGGTPREVFAAHGAALEARGIWLPLASRCALALDRAGVAMAQIPLDVPELLVALRAQPEVMRKRSARVLAALLLPHDRARPPSGGSVLVRLRRAACAPLFGPVVLPAISLDVHAGEVLGIVGSNGAGKSTLGACLAGLLPLRAGQREGTPGALAFQSPESQFVADSVAAELRMAGVPATQVAAVLEHWGLGAVPGQHPFALSQGQKRRLSLALIAARDRWPLVVLDEPGAGLDSHGTDVVAGDARRLAQAGRAVAVITHDMDFALRVCDRLVVLGGGRVLADGPPARLFRQPGLLARAGLAAPQAVPLLEWLEVAA